MVGNTHVDGKLTKLIGSFEGAFASGYPSQTNVTCKYYSNSTVTYGGTLPSTDINDYVVEVTGIDCYYESNANAASLSGSFGFQSVKVSAISGNKLTVSNTGLRIMHANNVYGCVGAARIKGNIYYIGSH